jgi:hypothetical protein
VSEEDGVSRTLAWAGADTVQAMATGDLRHAPIKKLVRRIRSDAVTTATAPA